MRTIVRIFLQLLFVLGGCALFVARAGGGDAGMIYILPVILGLPGALVSLLILAPLETALDRRNLGVCILVAGPLACALVPWLLFPLAGNTSNFMAGAPMLSMVGLAWGLLWAITYPVGRSRKASPGR